MGEVMGITGAFGSLLTSAIENMDGVQGYSGWRWIFILEGPLIMVDGILTAFLLIDFPEDAAWLTPEERQYMHARLLVEEEERPTQMSTASGLGLFVSDYKAYLGALLYFGASSLLSVPRPHTLCAVLIDPRTGGNLVGYSLIYFLPSVAKSFHYSATQTQLHSVPPFAAACWKLVGSQPPPARCPASHMI